MCQLIETLSLAGIVNLGEVYIFTEYKELSKEACDLDMLNVIRNVEELRTSLEIELFYMNKWLDIRRVIGYTRISDRSFEFKMDCYDRDWETDKVYCLYLHRLLTAKERLAQVKESWEVDSLEIKPYDQVILSGASGMLQ